MKAIIILVLLGGLALGGVYFFGGYHSFDPEKQGQEARQKIKPGMSLQQVVKLAGKNPKYRAINLVKTKVGKETMTEAREGTPVEFNHDRVQKAIKEKQLPAGFILDYHFSERTAFAVHFDEAGDVTEITDLMTMADLLHTR